MTDEERIEALAALQHEQWMTWAMNIMETEPGLSPSRFYRWGTMMVPYEALTEEEKEQDRVWARRVLEVLVGPPSDTFVLDEPVLMSAPLRLDPEDPIVKQLLGQRDLSAETKLFEALLRFPVGGGIARQAAGWIVTHNDVSKPMAMRPDLLEALLAAEDG